MRKRALILVLGVSLSLTACGIQQEGDWNGRCGDILAKLSMCNPEKVVPAGFQCSETQLEYHDQLMNMPCTGLRGGKADWWGDPWGEDDNRLRPLDLPSQQQNCVNYNHYDDESYRPLDLPSQKVCCASEDQPCWYGGHLTCCSSQPKTYPTKPDSCQGVPYEGCCSNGTSYRCLGGSLLEDKCGWFEGCGWSDTLSSYRCFALGSDPSGQFTKQCPWDH